MSILHGEQIGLIIALMLAGQSSSDLQQLLTDHLNSVRLIEDSKSNISQIPHLCNMNKQSCYQWILSLMDRTNIDVKYMPVHSDEEIVKVKMNHDAELYMSSSHNIQHMIPQSPVPTFHMNKYTFSQEGDSWIESNIGEFINMLMAHKVSTSLGIGNNYQMSTWAHDQLPPPDFPYLKATSAHSAAVQL